MDLFHLIYSSRPFGFDDAVLNGILATSRRNNVRNDLTGCLICRSDIYLQLLEGPKPQVEAAYARIARDNRHVEVTLHVSSKTPARLFGKWAMRDDPATSWMWTASDIAGGALARATPDDVLAIFVRLSQEL